MDIQVWADFHCPYCYIGKERFHQALAALGLADKARIIPRSFLLNPKKDRPEGLILSEHVKREYGTSLDKILDNFRRLNQQARTLGLPMDMEQARYASMMDAHRLLQYAKTQGLGEAFFRKAQEALFAHGAVLSERDTLLEIAVDTGLIRDAVIEVLDSGRFQEEVLAEDRTAREMNIDYVPYYLVDQAHHFSGDLDREEYERHLKKASP